jgi:hypothetical protein
VLNWLDGTKPLVESESQHLNDPEDLVALASNGDISLVDWFVEYSLEKMRCGKVCFKLR